MHTYTMAGHTHRHSHGAPSALCVPGHLKPSQVSIGCPEGKGDPVLGTCSASYWLPGFGELLSL